MSEDTLVGYATEDVPKGEFDIVISGQVQPEPTEIVPRVMPEPPMNCVSFVMGFITGYYAHPGVGADGEPKTRYSMSITNHEFERQPDGSFERVTFTYDELDDSAKDKAREWYTSRDYPFDEWYDDTQDWYKTCDPDEFVRKTRPYFYPEELKSFDIDRGAFAQITGYFSVKEAVAYLVKTYEERPAQAPGFRHTIRYWRRLLQWLSDGTIHDYNHQIRNSHYGHGTYGNHIGSVEFEWVGDFDEPPFVETFAHELTDMLEQDVKEIEQEVLTQLRAEHNGMFEDEYVAESIRINNHLFTAEGEHHGV